MIDQHLIDVTLPEQSGYPVYEEAKDSLNAMADCVLEAGGLVTAFPDHMWVERKDWREVQKLGEKNKTRAIDFLDRFTNQSPSHECVCHALTSGASSVRNRQRRIALGPPVAHQILDASRSSASVWLSPLSLYSELNPRRWGGSNVRSALALAMKRGILPDRIQPRDYGFTHTLTGTSGKGNECQSGGEWVRLRDFPNGWGETAKHFKPKEVIFPENFEQMICLLLGGPEAMGLPVMVGGRSHSIPYMFVDVEKSVIGYPDSYDVIRYDTFVRYRSGGMYAIWSMDTPDDWNKPAG